MKPIENNKNAAEKNPAEFRDFKKVGKGSIPSEKKTASEPKQPVTNPRVELPRKLQL